MPTFIPEHRVRVWYRSPDLPVGEPLYRDFKVVCTGTMARAIKSGLTWAEGGKNKQYITSAEYVGKWRMWDAEGSAAE